MADRALTFSVPVDPGRPLGALFVDSEKGTWGKPKRDHASPIADFLKTARSTAVVGRLVAGGQLSKSKKVQIGDTLISFGWKTLNLPRFARSWTHVPVRQFTCEEALFELKYAMKTHLQCGFVLEFSRGNAPQAYGKDGPIVDPLPVPYNDELVKIRRKNNRLVSRVHPDAFQVQVPEECEGAAAADRPPEQASKNDSSDFTMNDDSSRVDESLLKALQRGLEFVGRNDFLAVSNFLDREYSPKQLVRAYYDEFKTSPMRKAFKNKRLCEYQAASNDSVDGYHEGRCAVCAQLDTTISCATCPFSYHLECVDPSPMITYPYGGGATWSCSQCMLELGQCEPSVISNARLQTSRHDFDFERFNKRKFDCMLYLQLRGARRRRGFEIENGVPPVLRRSESYQNYGDSFVRSGADLSGGRPYTWKMLRGLEDRKHKLLPSTVTTTVSDKEDNKILAEILEERAKTETMKSRAAAKRKRSESEAWQEGDEFAEEDDDVVF